MLVRVQPRSSANAVNGVKGGTLSVRLTSPPVDGEANAALISFLSKLLKFKKSALRIESGERSKEKRLKFLGVSLKEVEALFEPHLRSLFPGLGGG